jgi:hypothetical protein
MPKKLKKQVKKNIENLETNDENSVKNKLNRIGKQYEALLGRKFQGYKMLGDTVQVIKNNPLQRFNTLSTVSKCKDKRPRPGDSLNMLVNCANAAVTYRREAKEVYGTLEKLSERLIWRLPYATPEWCDYWQDKWWHGYVGCKLHRDEYERWMVEWWSELYEFKDSVETGKPVSNEDHQATMWGYDHAYDTAYWVWYFHDGIVTLIHVELDTCVDICDYNLWTWFLLTYNERAKRVAANLTGLTPGKKLMSSAQFKKTLTKRALESFTSLDFLKIFKDLMGKLTNPVPLEPPQTTIYVNFLLNANTKEIHDLRRSTPLCNLPDMKPGHKMYLENITQVKKVLELGFDGCKHCMPQYHED